MVSAYRFHMFELARQLQRHKMLNRLVTCMPKIKLDEVSRHAVDSRPWLASLRLAMHRASGRNLPGFDRALIADFDRWASRRIRDADVVSCLSSFGTLTLREARRRGTATVCDRGSWHILEQKAVLDDEAAKLLWPRVPFDQWIIERELEEYDSADAIFVPSEPARLSFVRRGIPPGRLHCVPYGCDLSVFSPAPAERRPGRILSVGPVGIQKGHPYLLSAYRNLAMKRSSLVLVGPCDREAARRLGLRSGNEPNPMGGSITVLGAVPRQRVAEEMRRASVFVLASVHEGLAMVIAQAMASGLPVIATEATGARALITNGVEGLIVPAADEGALTEAMALLLDQPLLAQEMGRAGHARISSLGGWDEYGRRAVEAFGAVVASR